MNSSSESLRTAMRNWASGVTIVSTAHENTRHGMTVSSFTSISIEPPLILVSLYNESRTKLLVSKAGYFGVTILDEGQEEISNRFAGRIPDEADRFAGLETESLKTGSPFIVGGLSFFDCRVIQQIPFGSNTLFIGEVLASRSRNDGEPLLYFNQGYRLLK